MSATIYHLSDYARVRHGGALSAPPKIAAHKIAACKPPTDGGAEEHQGGLFALALVIFAIVFVVIGVCLFDGVAAIGRVHNDCLQSGRRACGIFHSAADVSGSGAADTELVAAEEDDGRARRSLASVA